MTTRATPDAASHARLLSELPMGGASRRGVVVAVARAVRIAAVIDGGAVHGDPDRDAGSVAIDACG
jgi:hypothetical protein